MIYFMQADEGDVIKIGTSIRVTQRLGYLRLETGDDLRVLAVMDGGRKEEKVLHRRFAHLRAENHALSERFNPARDLLDFIASNGREWDGTDEKPKREQSGTLIRVSDEFAEAMRTASSFEKASVAAYATAHLLPIVLKRYREAIVREAKKMEEKGK